MLLDVICAGVRGGGGGARGDSVRGLEGGWWVGTWGGGGEGGSLAQTKREEGADVGVTGAGLGGVRRALGVVELFNVPEENRKHFLYRC